MIDVFICWAGAAASIFSAACSIITVGEFSRGLRMATAASAEVGEWPPFAAFVPVVFLGLWTLGSLAAAWACWTR